MLGDKKIIVVMPGYNAAKTLQKTYAEIPFDMVDEVILVDDASSDNTVEVAKSLGLKHIVVHQVNKGYGGNQKSCYARATELQADIVVMLHPDYQYTPRLIKAMCSLIAEDVYQVVLGSRILGKGALKGGMPLYKYFFNRVLTLTQNIIIGQKLSEYHTGFRAFSKEALNSIHYQYNSDDFVFDNQMLLQLMMKGFDVAEITCPTKYFADASSINFSRSMRYGWGVLFTSFQYRLHKWGVRQKLFS